MYLSIALIEPLRIFQVLHSPPQHHHQTVMLPRFKGTGPGLLRNWEGLSVCKRKRGQVESSTVILTFPFISSSVVPVLSGLSVFVGAVQSQLTWPTESRAAGRRGRAAGDGRNKWRRCPHRQSSHQARGGLFQDAVRHVVRVQRAEAGVEARMVLGGGASVRKGVGEKARVELLQVSGSSSMRGVREVGACREVWVHPKEAGPLKVFPQNLGTLLLVHQSSSWGSKVRPLKVVGHQAELLADSRGGGGRGRCQRVVRVGCCRRRCYGRRPLCLQKALMLEQPGQVWIRAQGQVRVCTKCQSLPAVLMLLLSCQLPQGVPCEAMRTL